ncbi:DUF1236 domain-containing protein [Pararhizobium sp. YC-54]|uniref:DUF1236 domain-containing protein n=1 Tax=Pararhizobium sp. YC-54 TaxID=2986920 RepID=UPI0021F6C4D2|nr:DUF1236 domain-containing protein [Pararhizobium sp. YC-54]MCV9999424.1 DUF1236 domain-containing protein [Pararhizobium sp. YC-54]
MNIVSKRTIAAILLSGTAFIGGAAMAQEQSVDGAGTSEGGANVIVPQAGASGQVDTSAGANTSAVENNANADAAASKKIENGSAAEGSAQTEAGGSGGETAGSAGTTAVEEDNAKASQLDANGQSSTTTTTTKDAETAADPAAAEQSDEASTSKPSNETTATIDITTEQRTEIRNVIVESKAEPVDLDIQVNVGVVVPKTVELRPLPPRIIEIVPAYRSYEYFVLADGRIIIVEPGTLKVVYVFAA